MPDQTHRVVVQKWEESEKGWGTRPDGYSLHLSEKDRADYVREYWAEQKAKSPQVPDDYSREDGTPYEAEVDKETFEEVKASKNGIRDFGTPPGSGGNDGWRRMK
jgi:hypothetical protein